MTTAILRTKLRRGVLPAFAALAALALAPAGAHAELSAGHPEAYSNGIRVGNGVGAAIASLGYGDIELKSAELENPQKTGGYIECTNLGMGSLYNAGTPSRAVGQILGWTAQGHAANAKQTHTELSSECRGLNSVSNNIAETAFATDETHINYKSGEESRGEITVPWNVEAECGTREKVKVTIIKIGVPTNRTTAEVEAAEKRACETEKAEETEVKKEIESKEGCYAGTGGGKIAPAGCVQVLVFAPAIGLEVAYGGTQRVKAIAGAGNGLDQTTWEFEKPELTGTLACDYPLACSAKGETSGNVKQQGYEAAQLINDK